MLARKFTSPKWEPREELGRDEIPADAVTGDLRTTSNTLSFWRFDSDGDVDLERAVLALASSADRADRFDLVWIEEQQLVDRGLRVRRSPGRTPMACLRDHHVDLERLDLERLRVTAGFVATAARQRRWRRWTKRDVVELISKAVDAGGLSLVDLKEDLRREVSRWRGESD